MLIILIFVVLFFKWWFELVKEGNEFEKEMKEKTAKRYDFVFGREEET